MSLSRRDMIMNNGSTRLIEWVLIGLSTLAFSVYCYIAFSRMTYPFSIEWFEGNTFTHITRILEGKPIFSPPSYDFIPTILMPLYYYTTALLAKITGQIMFSMRLVSFMASQLAFVSIYSLCRERQISPVFSVTAIGLFAASYGVTGYWFDLGIVDMLFVSLLLFAYLLSVTRTKHEKLVGIVAGFILFFSYTTKQTAIAALPFILIYLLLNRRWTKALFLGVSFSILWIMFVMVMNNISKEWFWLYTYVIPAAHPISINVITHEFWTQHILSKFPWIIGIMVLAVILLIRVKERKILFDEVLFGFSFLLPLCLMSLASMSKQWGYVNGLLSMAAALAVVGMEAFQRIVTLLNSRRDHIQWHNSIYYLASAAIILQFLGLRYDFRSQIPNPTSIKAGNRILKIIRTSEDPIFIPTSSYLLYLTNKPIHYHVSSMGDIELASDNNGKVDEITKEYRDSINEYLLSGSIKTAILSNATWFDKVFSEENGYKCESLLNGKPPLITVTGAISWLDRICRKVE